MVLSDFEQKFECGVAARPIFGEDVSGDRHLIKFHPEGVLFAVVDGAGHGSEAASSSAIALSVLEANANLPPNSLLSLCHEALRSTRGAVISLASIRASDALMSWAGIGNVEVVHLRMENFQRKRETLLLRNGVLGYQYSPPRESTLPLGPGDMLIFATDGIASYFLDGISLEDPCQSIADSILNQHAKDSDDALVLVVRIIERPA